LLTLIVTCEPDTTIDAPPLLPNVDFACASRSLPLAVNFSVVPILKALQ